MATNYQFLTGPDLNQTQPSNNVVETDWKVCALCQQDTDERLIYPDGKKNKLQPSGYGSLARKLLHFHNLGSVPLNIDISRLDEGSGISQTLQFNHAGGHKSCQLLLCTMKLQRAQKRAKMQQMEDIDNLSPVKTRRCTGHSSTVVYDKTVCFFCDQTREKEILHSAATANIDTTVRECATALRDTNLLAKLAAGDMVAIVAMYHLSCLTKLRNRLRDHKTNQNKEKMDTSVEALVFAELVGYTEETSQNEVNVPVFKLSELVKMFTTRLAELEPQESHSGRVYSARLKERLLHQIPDLRAEQQGRDILLIFEKDIGGAIKRAIADDMDAEAIHLVRAAQVVRKYIFDKQYEFTGSFQRGCESNAVPQSLNALVRMILEGPNIENQCHANTTKEHIALSLSQLLLFNTVKRSRASVGI